MSSGDDRFETYVEGTGSRQVGIFETLEDVLSALTGNYRPGVVVAEALLALAVAGVIVLK
jgi:hypothetical protein